MALEEASVAIEGGSRPYYTPPKCLILRDPRKCLCELASHAISLWQDGMFSSYPALREARERWQAQAITRDSPFKTRFCQLAKELHMAVAITYLEQ